VRKSFWDHKVAARSEFEARLRKGPNIVSRFHTESEVIPFPCRWIETFGSFRIKWHIICRFEPFGCQAGQSVTIIKQPNPPGKALTTRPESGDQYDHGRYYIQARIWYVFEFRVLRQIFFFNSISKSNHLNPSGGKIYAKSANVPLAVPASCL
jgi:hypothetical protein